MFRFCSKNSFKELSGLVILFCYQGSFVSVMLSPTAPLYYHSISALSTPFFQLFFDFLPTLLPFSVESRRFTGVFYHFCFYIFLNFRSKNLDPFPYCFKIEISKFACLSFSFITNLYSITKFYKSRDNLCL
jgi:hypothetical protein